MIVPSHARGYAREYHTAKTRGFTELPEIALGKCLTGERHAG
jgi:hypothetical protein